MKNRIVTTFLALLCTSHFSLFSELAFAEERLPPIIAYDDMLGLVGYVSVTLSDNVTENCWTNADKILANAKLKFEENGIEVIEYETAASLQGPNVFLSVTGFRANGRVCVGSASFKVNGHLFNRRTVADTDSEFILLAQTVLFETGSLYTSGKNMNGQLEDFFETSVSQLLLKIIKAKRQDAVSKLLVEDPYIGERPDPKNQD